MNTSFHGLHVIESPYLLQDGKPYEVRRTWRERLFALPWQPFLRTRVVVPKVPHRGIVRLGTTLVVHPETLRLLRSQENR